MTDAPEKGGDRPEPAPPSLHGCRIRFSKDGIARFLSHHDLLRTFERCLRRSGLKPAYTKGMNPHPRISVRPALALGARALAAAFDLFLFEPADPASVADSVGATMPEGIGIVAASAFPGTRPAAISGVCWAFDLPAPGDAELAGFSAMFPDASLEMGERVRINLPAERGREPAGPRAMAGPLWPSLCGDAALAATLESVSFEDGI